MFRFCILNLLSVVEVKYKQLYHLMKIILLLYLDIKTMKWFMVSIFIRFTFAGVAIEYLLLKDKYFHEIIFCCSFEKRGDMVWTFMTQKSHMYKLIPSKGTALWLLFFISKSQWDFRNGILIRSTFVLYNIIFVY